MKKEDLKTGDVFFVKFKKGIIPKITGRFLRFQNWRMGSKIKLKNIPSHCGTIVRDGNKLFVCESNLPGVEYEEWPGRYSEEYLLNNVQWKTPIDPFTGQQRLFYKELCKYFDIAEYDIPGYIAQGLYTTLGIWVGKKGVKAEDKLTCSELIPTIVNRVFEETPPFKTPWSENPLTLFLHPFYKFKE